MQETTGPKASLDSCGLCFLRAQGLAVCNIHSLNLSTDFLGFITPLDFNDYNDDWFIVIIMLCLLNFSLQLNHISL